MQYVDPATNARSWYGPLSVTEADGSLTKYQYNPMGEVTVKTIFAGTGHSVQYGYQYDLAGHVTSLTTTPVDASGTAIGSPPTVTNTYDYDGLGRLLTEVDNYHADDPVMGPSTEPTANRKTTYAYTSVASTGTTELVTYPNNETETIVTYLDGSRASVTGNATTPAAFDEGVVTPEGLVVDDASGTIVSAVDASLSIGSTWTSTTANGSANTTRSYVNLLGEPYLTQQTKPTAGEAGRLNGLFSQGNVALLKKNLVASDWANEARISIPSGRESHFISARR